MIGDGERRDKVANERWIRNIELSCKMCDGTEVLNSCENTAYNVIVEALFKMLTLKENIRIITRNR